MASDDQTGNSQLDGDWELEYQVSEIEANLIFDDVAQKDYKGVLEGHDFGLNIGINDPVVDLPNFIDPIDINVPTTQELAFQFDSLFYVDENTLGINIDSPIFDPSINYEIAYPNDGDYNAWRYNFTTENLNFNQNTFNFSSISTNSNTITFGFDNQLDFSTISDSNTVNFGFLDSNELASGRADGRRILRKFRFNN